VSEKVIYTDNFRIKVQSMKHIEIYNNWDKSERHGLFISDLEQLRELGEICKKIEERLKEEKEEKMIKSIRAWDFELQKMYKVCNINYVTGFISLGCYDLENPEGWLVREADKIDLMYGTGVKDRNGVEIFEKDIIKVFGYPFGNLIVLWDPDELTWVLKRDLTSFTLLYLALYSNKSDMLEIVGNLYEGIKKEE